MATKKRNVYKPKPMTEGKRNLIQGLLQEYDIESAEDIQDALKDLLSGTIQGMLESERNEHLGYDKYEHPEESNYRNGTKSKSVRSKYGEFEVDVPQDRQSTFEKAARDHLEDVTEKWETQYPNAMNRWNENWDIITPIFKFSAEVRKAFYTTNAIESLNSSYRQLNRQRSVFPSSQSLLKELYLATFEATKKWTMPLRNWGKVRGELSIMFPDRLPD